MIEDLPYFLFFDLFVLAFMSLDEIFEVATLTIFHGDIDCQLSSIDVKVEVSQDVDVFQSEEGVDFMDDVLFLFGGDGLEGYFL